MAKKTKKDNSLRNAAIAFILSLGSFALTVGLRGPFSLFSGTLLSFLVALVVKAATTPMKGIEAPTSSAGIVPANIGDELAQSVVLKGLENLDALQKERLAINETEFTRRLQDLYKGYRELLNQVLADNSKANRMTELNAYYMPTIIKLLRSYRTAKGQGTSFMDISKTRADLIKTLDQLIEATHNLKRKMVQVDLDATRIKMDVLYSNLQASGLIEDEEADALRESAAEAAAAMSLAEQMGGANHAPVKAQPAPAPKAQRTPAVRPMPVAKEQPAPVMKPAPVVQAPTVPTIQTAPVPAANTRSALNVQPAPCAPTVTMEPVAVPQVQEAPVLPVSMPTASARQLSQGAPVLYVPGLLDDAPPAQNEHSSMTR